MAKKRTKKFGAYNRSVTKGAFGANRATRIERMRQDPLLRALMGGDDAGKPLQKNEHHTQ